MSILEFTFHSSCIFCKQFLAFSDIPRRWAWNNPHITKKIAREQRLTHPAKNTKKGSKTDGTRKRPVKPPMLLLNKLSNLHLLLRVPSFSRWPLHVRFFCEDVYQDWQKWNERVDGSIRDGVNVLLDLKQPQSFINDGEDPNSTQAKGKRKRAALGQGGIEGLDTGYSELKKHVEKSTYYFAEDEALKCSVCANNLRPKTGMAIVCPQEHCRTASHMACLASKFIEEEGPGAIVTPISGRCPSCKEKFQWIDLIKELSLRVRSEKEVAKVTKKPKEHKTTWPKTKMGEASQSRARTLGKDCLAKPDEDFVGADMCALDASDESLPDDWQYQDEEDDVVSVMSGNSALSDVAKAGSPTKRSSIASKLPAMIEDSEWDDADFPV